jgi:hypothetical protein
MPQLAEAEVAWQQLGDLIAVLCDSLGLRRPIEKDAIRVLFEQSTKAISESRIPVGSIRNQHGEHDIQEPLVPEEFTLQPTAYQSIESLLACFDQELTAVIEPMVVRPSRV